MSGLEVIGGISAVITLLGASIKIYDSAPNDAKLSETFEVVRRRLPVILHILQRCKDDLETRNDSMPLDVCVSLEKILDACDAKARKLKEIFEMVIPGEKDTREKRYAMVIWRLGKGNKVEDLMATLTQDVQLIVNNNGVNSATPEQNVELEHIFKEMKSVKSSTPEEEHTVLACLQSVAVLQCLPTKSALQAPSRQIWDSQAIFESHFSPFLRVGSHWWGFGLQYSLCDGGAP